MSSQELIEAIDKLKTNNEWLRLCGDLRKFKRIYFVANGGNLAVLDHVATDVKKQVGDKVGQLLVPGSLVNLSSLVTDYGDAHFAQWLKFQNPEPGDLLFAVSSDGNSKNVTKAIRCAEELGLEVAEINFTKQLKEKRAKYQVSLETDYYYVGETLLMLGLYGWIEVLGFRQQKV